MAEGGQVHGMTPLPLAERQDVKLRPSQVRHRLDKK